MWVPTSLMSLYEFSRVSTSLHEFRTEIGDAAEVEDVEDVVDVETAEIAVELEVELEVEVEVEVEIGAVD